MFTPNFSSFGLQISKKIKNDHFFLPLIWAIFGHFNVILYIFGIFLEISAILGQVIWCWYYWPHLDHFPKHFGSFCAIFGQYLVIFGHFRPFWAIFGHFWLFWVIFGHFRVIFDHFWVILGSFLAFLYAIFCHFGSVNSVLVFFA